MKKILGLVLVLALFVPAVAQAKINLYGQFDIMGGNWQGSFTGSNFQNEYSFTNSRFLLGANFDVDQNITGNLALIYARSWGQDYVAGQPVEDNATNDGVLNSIRIAEANIVFKNLFDNDRMSLKIGKFFIGEKGDSIFYIGLRDMYKFGIDYSLATGVYNANFFDAGADGVQITYDTKENFKMDLTYSKLANENTTYTGGDKINMFIADAKYKVNDNIKVRGYLYDSETTGFSIIGAGNRSEIIGIKPEVKFGNLCAALEYAQQFASPESKLFDETLNDANFVKGDISYMLDLEKDMMLTPRFTYLRAGEEFATWASDVNFGMALSSFFALSNLGAPLLNDVESYNFGVDFTVSKYKIMADYYSTLLWGSRFNEYDIKAEYNYSQKVKIYAGYAYFEDADYTDNYEIYSVLGVGYKF